MSRARDLGGRAVDALQNRNLVSNGGMQIHQRGTSISSLSDTFVGPADRWRNRLTAAGTWTASIETDVPLGTNLTKSMKYLCTTAAGTYTTGERFAVTQAMEYQNMYKILKPNSYNKKQISISFWVKSNVVGKYSVEIYAQDTSVGSSNGGQGRRLAISYNIVLANTWERKTIIFPEDNLGRVYNPQISGEALVVMFWCASGPFYKTGTYTSTWDDVIQGNRYPSDGVNIGSAIGNYWQFTGVQMEVSPSPTDFEYIPYTQDLLDCQRYYYQTDSNITASYSSYNSGNFISSTMAFPVAMRIPPSITLTDLVGNVNKMTQYPLGGQAVSNISVPSSVIIKNTHWFYEAGGSSNGSQGTGGMFGLKYSASADI
jgi:hypothetical protein